MAEQDPRYRVRQGKLGNRPVVGTAARARDAAGADGATLEARKRFSGFGDEDATLLAELGPTIDRRARDLVDRFYEHILATPVLRPYLADPAVVERLKRVQLEYLKSLFSGRYDDSYAETRRRIGWTHERIALEPQWHLGTYALYMQLLLPIVHEHYRANPSKGVRAGVALTKLVILDMQLALDAYYETRHRKGVQQSEQLAAVGELAASIAHEVRNPLAGMKGALEVLRTELTMRANREIVEELLAQITRLETLVRDLLTFARPTALTVKPCSLHDMLDRMLRTYQDGADVAGVTIQRIYGPGSGTIEADPQQLEQVFLNLIHNAFQAMEHGGTLTVTTLAEPGAVRISFHDTGKGIAPAELQRVFQPFFTTKHRGSGLGLPIVKKIVHAHGGVIEIESEPRRGTTVTLTLPADETT
jgi:signal transduction histidine kinase